MNRAKIRGGSVGSMKAFAGVYFDLNRVLPGEIEKKSRVIREICKGLFYWKKLWSVVARVCGGWSGKSLFENHRSNDFKSHLPLSKAHAEIVRGLFIFCMT